MTSLSISSHDTLDAVARRHGFSADAAKSMLAALRRGNGRMAQFSHAEFSGSGQWMRGGMTMVSDMFNHGLKARVDALCSELSALLAAEPEPADVPNDDVPHASGTDGSPGAGSWSWWPNDLRRPSASGAQDGVRYAYFATERRLAIERNGVVTVHDTLDHRIIGVSQQQSGTATLTFTSQHGRVDVDELPVVGSPDHESARRAPNTPTAGPSGVVALIAQLAELHARGVLSDAEFGAKKAELLSRI